MDGRASALCLGEALGDYTLVDDLYGRLMGVTRQQVQQVTADYLDAARACAVFYLPEGGRTRLADGGWPIVRGDGTVKLTAVSLAQPHVERSAAPRSDEVVEA
jgi:hypothetical protein